MAHLFVVPLLSFVLVVLQVVFVVQYSFFISKLIDKELKEVKFIDEKSHGFLCVAKSVEFAGFTEESYNWMFIFKIISLNELKLMDLSLSNLWKRTN
mgnify:CR=1 FL=1